MARAMGVFARQRAGKNTKRQLSPCDKKRYGATTYGHRFALGTMGDCLFAFNHANFGFNSSSAEPSRR